MDNISKKYYKDYFNEISESTVTNKNAELINYSECHKIYNCAEEDDCFTLRIAYPGLITGVGICHEMGIKGELKLGMHFDYTIGMPIIYGSSVKGVLSDNFFEFFDEWADIEINNVKNFNKSIINKEHLFFDIFGDDLDGKIKNCHAKSIYNRDIFFDAVINKKNRRNKILDADSITPHENPLSDPVPLGFLKIASGVEIQFRFKLNNFTSMIINNDKKDEKIIFTSKNKLDLFKYILQQVGIGAKTNVGYGQFEDI